MPQKATFLPNLSTLLTIAIGQNCAPKAPDNSNRTCRGDMSCLSDSIFENTESVLGRKTCICGKSLSQCATPLKQGVTVSHLLGCHSRTHSSPQALTVPWLRQKQKKVQVLLLEKILFQTAVNAAFSFANFFTEMLLCLEEITAPRLTLEAREALAFRGLQAVRLMSAVN